MKYLNVMAGPRGNWKRFPASEMRAILSFTRLPPEPVERQGDRGVFTRTGHPIAETTTVPQPQDGPPDVARILSVAADVGMVIVPPHDAAH